MEIFPNLHMALCTITPTNNNQLEKNMLELTNNENNTNLIQNNQENFQNNYLLKKKPLVFHEFLVIFNYNILRCQIVTQVFWVQNTPNININKPCFNNEHQWIQILNPQPISS
jgi:hypothetical protein